LKLYLLGTDGSTGSRRQRPDDPVGIGGLRLHEWHWYADDPGHEADAPPRDDLMRRRGAYVFDRVEDPGLEPVEVIHSAHATHVRYRINS
jgi:hypothetical protein